MQPVVQIIDEFVASVLVVCGQDRTFTILYFLKCFKSTVITLYAKYKILLIILHKLNFNNRTC